MLPRCSEQSVSWVVFPIKENTGKTGIPKESAMEDIFHIKVHLIYSATRRQAEGPSAQVIIIRVSTRKQRNESWF